VLSVSRLYLEKELNGLGRPRFIMQEWFDKEFTAREVYGRLFKRARKYSLALFLGVFSGMLVGGTWLPMFQLLRPAVLQMQVGPVQQSTGGSEATTVKSQERGEGAAVGRAPVVNGVKQGGVPGWFKEVEKAGKFCGIKMTDEQGDVRGSFLLMMLVVVPLALVFRIGTLYLNNYTLQWAGTRVVRDLRNEMFEHLQKQSLKFFGRMDVGRIMSRCNGDPGTVQTVVTHTVAEMCRAPFEIIASIGFVIYFAIKNDMIEMIGLAFLGYPLAMYPLLWIGKKIRTYARKGLERGAALGSNMLENLTGIRVVKAYNTEEEEKRKYRDANQRCVKMALKGTRAGLLVTPMMEAATIMLAVIFLAICFWKGKTFADIVPLLAPFVVAYKPLKSLAKIQTSIESGRAALTRIYSFLDMDTSLPLAQNPVPKKTFDDVITFDHVGFSYDVAGRKIVQDVSFNLKRGMTIAVVGSTGSGKTTLANLLARFYDPTEGRILMDGVDLRDMDIGDLRNLIGVVTQETILFNTTIAENISYGTKGATSEQIEAAAKMANAHPFIIQHPGGYQRIVGDKGFVLSGGERQRVAIARAILKNPPILILDEATSALDTVTEQQVQEAITHLMENRTVFVIAHRLSTIKNADQILVMDHGRVIERGSHEELYAKGGVYHGLCNVQS
jgi:ATP-binding cassette, subfamily B, bacterial MsbA